MTWVALNVLVGLCLGSFGNVLIHRLPRGEPIAWSISACPDCGEPIRWFDNLPLVSYLLLKGRCRQCGETISLRYPLVELSAGVILGLLAWLYAPASAGDWLNYLVLGSFLLLLIPIALIDLEHRIIPNGLNLVLFGLGALFSPFSRHPWGEGSLEFSTQVFVSSWLGLLVGGGLMLGLAYGAHWYYGEVALGMGDVKFIGAAGLWMGPGLILMTLFSGAFLGAVIGSVAGTVTGKGLKMEVPFGPFLCLGAAVMFVTGGPLLDWWLGPLG